MSFEIYGDQLGKYTEEDGVTEVIIPDGVKIIRKRAFYNCSSLTSITIPDSITDIKTSVFHGCINLKVNAHKKSWVYGYLKRNKMRVNMIPE